MTIEEIKAAITSYYPNPPLIEVEGAHAFAAEHHQGQVRASGEPYLVHLEQTALIACQLRLDIPTIIAALLHDVIEDTGVSREDLEDRFGADIAAIVDGVTKLTRIEFESREQKQAESFRKMLIAMAQDMRVVLVKLCDRLHNMRTLDSFSDIKKRRIAKETEEIYAPIANRLGIHWLKSELEDLCLLHLRPEMYRYIEESLGKTAVERNKYTEETSKILKRMLEHSGISGSVSGRAKHYYSIWRKMEANNLTPEEVNDVIGFRVIVPTVRACYESLGVVHESWKPVAGRFKDYIAMPKLNSYQSLHTTVIGPSGQRIEVQIRTPEMNRIAEEGIAAHWRYKEQGARGAVPGFDLRWVKDLVESQQYLKNSDEFIQSVKTELFPEQVFVFTPKGETIRLPFGSCPIDFAYAVHTDIGNRIIGAKVNGLMVALGHKLNNGDTVEVLTSNNQTPKKDWLRIVQSSKAKQRIRAFVRSEERSHAMAVGIEQLTRELRKAKQNFRKLEKEGRILEAAQLLGLKAESDLYADLGYGKLATARVISKLVPEDQVISTDVGDKVSQLERIRQRAIHAQMRRVGVKVSGLDNVFVRFARCCEPLPGDRIVGFITRGRGVTIHFRDCPQVMECDPSRLIDVAWEGEIKTERKIKVALQCRDRIGLLVDLSRAITSQGANIVSAQCRTSATGKAVNVFEISINDARQLDAVKRALEMVPGVTRVERLTHVLSSIKVEADDVGKGKGTRSGA